MSDKLQTTYSNAPIVEAIVEFRYESPLDEKSFEKLSTALEKHFPDIEEQTNVGLHVDMPAGKVTQNNERGVIHSRDDQTKVVVIRPKSLICSLKAPYTDFNEFRSHLERVWDASQRALSFRRIERIGMRYINRIDLVMQENQVEYEDYLNLHVRLPITLQPITSYNIDFTFDIPQILSTARIISTVRNDIVINHASFFLDIDIGRTIDIPQKKESIFNLLAEIRLHKNALFEQFITDKSRALFNA